MTAYCPNCRPNVIPIAECSCRKQYVIRDDQRDGPFWDEKR